MANSMMKLLSLFRKFNLHTRPLTTHSLRLNYPSIVLICLTIFLITFGVRLLHLQDMDVTRPKYYSPLNDVLSQQYKFEAGLLSKGDINVIMHGPVPLNSGYAHPLTHPPGYTILLALIYKLFGSSDTILRIFHITCDGTAAILVFFIVAELLPVGGAIIAGMLVALSPQLSYHSIWLQPESLIAPLLLLSIYLIIHATRRPRLKTIIAAGALVGLSCWLRSNPLLLAPFLAIFLLPLLFKRGMRLRYAGAFVGAMVLVVAPITIRNWVLFGHFVPLSLGAGLTLVIGIGDYDKEGRFGMPREDFHVMQLESKSLNRPDYLQGLFHPDGYEREQWRIARSWAVIRSHPIWFLGVMINRGTNMLRQERVDGVLPEPAIAHSVNVIDQLQPLWSAPPLEWVEGDGGVNPRPEVSFIPESQMLRIVSARPGGTKQIISRPITLQENNDYVLKLPVIIEQGALVVSNTSLDQNSSFVSTEILHAWTDLPKGEVTSIVIRLPFVSRGTKQIRVVLSDGGEAKDPPLIAQVGQAEIFSLGPASGLWTKYPRIIIRTFQKFFMTPWILPLAIIGIFLLKRMGQGRAAITLSAIPIYYLFFQSMLHTEWRFILPINYFLYLLAAVAGYWMSIAVWQNIRLLKNKQ